MGITIKSASFLACVLVLLTSVGVTYADWQVTQVTNNDYDDIRPDISGTNVVWCQQLGSSGCVVNLYDGSTTTQISDLINSTSTTPRVSGSNAAWQIYRESNRRIFFYDGSSTTEIEATTFIWDGPLASGSNIAWDASVDGIELDIYLYDGSTTTKIPGTSGHNLHDLSGSRTTSTKDGEVFLYDGTNTIQLTNNSYSDTSPRVSETHVVWRGFDGNDFEIFMYDGSTVSQLTDNDYDDWDPVISGSRVAWTGTTSGDTEVFFYDGTSIEQITSSLRDDWSEGLDISATHIVWQGWDDDDTDYEINVYDGSTTAIITDNDYNDEDPRMSDSSIAWQAWDGSDWEIFTATPVPEAATLFLLAIGGLALLRRKR